MYMSVIKTVHVAVVTDHTARSRKFWFFLKSLVSVQFFINLTRNMLIAEPRKADSNGQKWEEREKNRVMKTLKKGIVKLNHNVDIICSVWGWFIYLLVSFVDICDQLPIGNFQGWYMDSWAKKEYLCHHVHIMPSALHLLYRRMKPLLVLNWRMIKVEKASHR